MGCDIHLFVEKKTDAGWINIESPDTEQYKWGWAGWRNYNAFAILADVRNGHGFAGSDTGDALVPISMPRGLPRDMSEEASDDREMWGQDGHSGSWLYLQELREYDWEQSATLRGFVNAQEYKVLKDTGSPSSWFADVGGGRIKKVTNKEMEQSTIEDDASGISLYTQVEWEWPYKVAARVLYDFIFSDEIRAVGDPKKVRFVFWFDN
jgi:hypothetical protein